MVTREEILMASGAELDAVASRIDPNFYRSTSYATDFNGIGSCSYRIPKSDDKYREELLKVFDSMVDGGPAFGEFKQAGECSIKTGGMTLRDYFAAKCCAAMVSSIQDDTGYSRAAQIAHSNGGMNVSQWFASESYKQADAMLRERAK